MNLIINNKSKNVQVVYKKTQKMKKKMKNEKVFRTANLAKFYIKKSYNIVKIYYNYLSFKIFLHSYLTFYLSIYLFN